MASPAKKHAHIPELDGVRGIAVLLVMIFHFGGGYAETQHNLLASAIGLGWSGVDLFFVLSGFLITTILLGTRKDPHFFRNFYLRRALRILPLYYLYLIAFAFIFLPVAHHYHKFLSDQIGQLSLYWVHLSNWGVQANPMSGSPVAQMWSLAIEEQFYFLWPLLVFLLPDEILLLVCFALAATSLGLRLTPSMQAIQLVHPEFLYRLTPFRIEPLCYGAMIALLTRRIQGVNFRGWAGWGSLVSGVGLLCFLRLHGNTLERTSLNMAGFGYTGIGLCAAGLVLLALRHEGSNATYAHVLRSRVLRTLGKYSYAMYIFHVPISQFIQKAISHFIKNPLLGLAFNFILGIGLTFLMAKLSWKYFESPILSLKDRIAGYRKAVDFSPEVEKHTETHLAGAESSETSRSATA
jgi:peptidoglycan/LPS O-acetylase OafA/YrhL